VGLVLTPLSFVVFGLLMGRPLHSASATLVGAVGGLFFGVVVLLVVAEFGLHWNAGQVFAASGLMASVSACGAAAGKHGGKAGAWGVILPMLGGGVLMLLWMGAGMLLGMMGGR
jgi:hypothetical protein